MRAQLLVLAKTPAPGRVKTRLCPPYTPEQAARIAAAALADTLDSVAARRDTAADLSGGKPQAIDQPTPRGSSRKPWS